MAGGGTLALFSHHADDVCAVHEERVGDVTSVTDRVASATVALDRLTAVCDPVTRDGAAPQDPALLLTCYRSTARTAEPRDVVARNALGKQSLTLRGLARGVPARPRRRGVELA